MDCQRVLRISLNFSMKGWWKKFLMIWMAFTLFCMMVSQPEQNIVRVTLIIAVVLGFVVASVFRERRKKEMKMEIAGYARIILSSKEISEEDKSAWGGVIGQDAIEFLEENKAHLSQREIDHFLTWAPL